jgi:hypothetical protein
MRFYEFRYLVEGYPQAQAAFAQVADAATVQKTIADFKQLVSRNQIKDTNQKNIDYWIKQGWDKFNSFVNQAVSVPSKSQVVKKKLPGQSITLVDNASWFIIIPIDKEASCFHGKNSDWCTTKIHQGHFERYFYKSEITLIYCFNKSTGGMWAIAAHKKTDEIELFDQNDISMSSDEFTEETGLNPMELRNLALGDGHQPTIQSNRDKWKASVELTEKLISELPAETRSPEIEKQLLYNKEGGVCADYIKKIGMTNIDSKKFPLAIQVAAAGHDLNILMYVENPVEAVQVAAVSSPSNDRAFEDDEDDEEFPSAISLIIQDGIIPSERVQLAAVENYPDSFNNIIDAGIKPSEAVQLLAVKYNPHHLTDMLDEQIKPSEAVIKSAVSRRPELIEYIAQYGIKISEETQIEAVKTHPNSMKYIIKTGIKPSEAVQMAAVDQAYNSIPAFKSILDSGIRPSQAVQIAAVTHQRTATEYDGIAIENILRAGIIPSEAVQIAAVTNEEYGIAMRYIIQARIKPSEEVQLAAVNSNKKGDDYVIRAIVQARIKPSEAVQLAAVNRTEKAIGWISQIDKNPSEAVQLAAVKQRDGIYRLVAGGIKPSAAVLKAAGKTKKWYDEYAVMKDEYLKKQIK